MCIVLCADIVQIPMRLSIQTFPYFLQDCFDPKKLLSEQLHLQTASFFWICQRFLQVALKCSCQFNHLQRTAAMTVLSRSVPSARLRVSLTVAAERLAFTAGFETVLEDEEKSLDASLSYSDTLPLVPSSFFTNYGPILADTDTKYSM